MTHHPHAESHDIGMALCRRRMVRDLELFLGVALTHVDENHDDTTDPASSAVLTGAADMLADTVADTVPQPSSSSFDLPVYSTPTPEGRPC